jgi:4-amino-4-deoxy-L-arabinose transferase-like glycosyltransferase
MNGTTLQRTPVIENNPPRSNGFYPNIRHLLVLIVSIGAFFLLAFLVASAKRPWSDEGWFASPAFNLAYHGFMGTTVLYSPHLPRIEHHTYWILPLYLVGLAGWFKIGGFGLVTMRMFSALFGAVAVGAWYVVGRSLTRDPAVAGLTAVLLGTDYLFINIGTLGRPDMMCAGLGSLALAVYLLLRERHLGKAFFWANVPLACAFLTHPNAILFAAMFAMLVWALDRRSLSVRLIAAGATPYLIGGAIWLVYIGQDPSAFLAQIAGNADRQGRFGNFLHPWNAIKTEILGRYLTAYGLGPHSAGHTGPIVLKALVLVCYGLAIATCLSVASIRRRPGTKLTLAITGLVFFIQCFFNQKLSWYLAHIVPLYTVLLSIVFVALWQRRSFWRVIGAAIFAALLCVQVGGLLYLAKTNTYEHQYRPLLAFLNQLPPDQSIYGTAAIEFGLSHPERLCDDVSLGYYNRRQPSYIVMDPIYQDSLEGLSYNDAPAYESAERKLKAAHRVYDKGEFQVYATK